VAGAIGRSNRGRLEAEAKGFASRLVDELSMPSCGPGPSMPSLMARCPSTILGAARQQRARCAEPSPRVSPPPDAGSRDHVLGYSLARFIVEVPRSAIEGFIKFGFIRLDQQDDLAAIMGALRLLGEPAVVWRMG
jgi:hypothetical protein